jgi:hypothetical protein
MSGPHPRLTKQAKTERHLSDPAHPAHPSAAGRITKGNAVKRVAPGHGTGNRHSMLERLQAQGRLDAGTSKLRRADGSASIVRG